MEKKKIEKFRYKWVDEIMTSDRPINDKGADKKNDKKETNKDNISK